jgi:hypothetical protein
MTMTLGAAHPSSGIWIVLVAIWAVVIGLMVIMYFVTRKRNADLAFTVGQDERHEVRYQRSNWSGRTRITVDGNPIVRKLEVLGFPLTKTYELRTGTTECHDITIVKTRPLFLAWMRPQPVHAFVDGALVATDA